MMFIQGSTFYSVLISSFMAILICFAVIAIFFHMFFTPDWRPGYNTMPFIWYQMVSSIYKRSQKIPVMGKIYNGIALAGMAKMMEKEKILSFTLCGKTYVFCITPEAAQVVLGSTTLVEKSDDYKPLKPLLLDGLLNSKPEKWRKSRKLLTPTFHFKILQDFSPLMKEISDLFVSRLKKTVNEPYIDINEWMKHYSSVMLMKTAMGLDLDFESEETKRVLAAVDEFVICFQTRLARPWLTPDCIYNLSPLSKRTNATCKIIHDYIRRVITNNKAKYLASQKNCEKSEVKANGHALIENETVNNAPKGDITTRKYKPYMDLLMELHMKDNSFTEEQILEESVIFFSGGFVTVASAITYVIYCIGLYKDVQKRLQEEAEEILQGIDRDLTEEDLNSWKYLDCVIKESFRLFSILYYSRLASESFKIYDYTVPKGSIVVIFAHAIQRNPEVYPNPEKFDPSRFYPENSVGRHPYSLLPFSAGPRNCIGQKFSLLQMKVVVSAIVRNFNIHSLDTRDKLYDINRLTTEKDIPVRVKFTLREKTKPKMS